MARIFMLGGADIGIVGLNYGDGRDGNFHSSSHVTLDATGKSLLPLIKQYSRFTLNEGHQLTLSALTPALILMSQEKMTVNGSINLQGLGQYWNVSLQDITNSLPEIAPRLLPNMRYALPQNGNGGAGGNGGGGSAQTYAGSAGGAKPSAIFGTTGTGEGGYGGAWDYSGQPSQSKPGIQGTHALSSGGGGGGTSNPRPDDGTYGGRGASAYGPNGVALTASNYLNIRLAGCNLVLIAPEIELNGTINTKANSPPYSGGNAGPTREGYSSPGTGGGAGGCGGGGVLMYSQYDVVKGPSYAIATQGSNGSAAGSNGMPGTSGAAGTAGTIQEIKISDLI